MPRIYATIGLHTHRQFLALLGAIIVLVGTFATDITTPRGFAAGVFPYFIGILLTAALPYRWAPYGFAAAASALTITGYFVTTGFVAWMVLSNRISLVFIYWIVAYLVRAVARDDELKSAHPTGKRVSRNGLILLKKNGARGGTEPPTRGFSIRCFRAENLLIPRWLTPKQSRVATIRTSWRQ